MAQVRWWAVAVVASVLVVVVAGVGLVSVEPAVAAGPTFGPTMERAPYGTDLTQTGAEVNWSTVSTAPAGSVQWVDETLGGTCPTGPWVWTAGRPTAAASTAIPFGPGGGTTGWAYRVGALAEHQDSARLTGLVAGHAYCYAVFSATKGGVDLLASPTWRSFTTLVGVSPGSTATVGFDVIGDTGENFQYTSGSATTGTVSTPFPSSIDPTGVENPYQSALYSEIGHDFTSGGAQFLLGAGDTSYSGGTEATLGDLTQPGTLTLAQGRSATEYSNIFGPTYLPEAGGIPTYLADGNHGRNANAMKAFPAQVSANTSGGTYAMDSYPGAGQPPVDGISGSFPDDWYAFSTGGVRIYVLDAAWADTMTGTAGSAYQADADEHWQPNSPEMKWLQADLKATPAGMVKLAVFHYPLASVGNAEPTDTYLDQRLEPVLAAGGVRLVFNGHSHTYQRIRPTVAGQIPSYVTGGGGGVPEVVDTNADLAGRCAAERQVAGVYAIGWFPSSPSPAKGSYCGQGPDATPTDVGQVYSYVHVTVANGTVTVNGVSADRGTFDLQRYPAASPPPPPPPPVSLVQSHGAAGTVNTLPGAARTGDLLVLSAGQYTGASNHITGVTDGAGDAWHLIGAADQTGHNSEGELWWTDAAGPVTAVTVKTAATSVVTEVQEFTGVAAGGPAAAVVTSGDSASAGAGATAPPGDLLVGFVAGHGSADTPSTEWNRRLELPFSFVVAA